jgi:hypothetical protein
MKYALGLNTALLIFVSLLTVCNSDSPGETGTFVIEIDKTYSFPLSPEKAPEEFKGRVPAIGGKIGEHDLGVIGSITDGILRLVLPTYIEDRYLRPFDSGNLKYDELIFIKGAFLFLSRDASLNAELFYFNQDAPQMGIRKGWNFRYREPGEQSYIYTSNIKALYTANEGYIWLVKVVPDTK